ncbi:6-phosphofructokinase [Oscillospiraceae bacterium OttesenSCG-928-G22]|nr:6-phosphofructokinase [Oscillospiraceae bacterium OttesenSCG-928-G22]
MQHTVNRIGVLTSGGDAPGMNAAIRAVVRSGVQAGYEVLGIKRGYNGLIGGDIVPLDQESVNGIITRGGTMLYTARSPEFQTEEGQKKAADTCRYMGISNLVVIGGDGTFRGAEALSRHGVSVFGIPATIDNDIGCTNYSIGFDTACNTALEALDKLRDTMQSHERCSVVEVMGRHAGHLAMYVGIACGATAALVPEYPVDFEADVIEKIRRGRINGRSHFLFIIAEGLGNTQEIAARINEETGLDPRVTILGHVQRGGAPSARDRVTATRMGDFAIDLIADGRENRVICTRNSEILDIDIGEAVGMKKGLQESMYRTLGNVT